MKMAARGMSAKKKDRRRRHAKWRKAAAVAAAAQDRPLPRRAGAAQPANR